MQTIFRNVEDDDECRRRTDLISRSLKELKWAERLVAVTRANWNVQRKFDVLYQLADDLNRISKPLSACSKLGCSHCCNIACEISDFEAERIGKAIRRKPVEQPQMTAELVIEKKARRETFRSPCTFLKDGRCSIYEVRPLACRTHHNVGTGAGCDLSIPSALSNVPSFDYRRFYEFVANINLTHGGTFADIREYFPGEKNED